ncbi:universal stress protein [Clostridium thermobutyricum]|uniref:Sensor protein KdpD n=1 Tax=Clostridium thermobutyricum DSM 4928 TaxID=1121339 RepID=A0A1V4SSH7_9CLOT|nr:universal stress protein [Clostridium thermobutyricum]OPX46802.1 sensor protein KdpD [Clostridium thermobutyricum DSM 4928]
MDSKCTDFRIETFHRDRENKKEGKGIFKIYLGYSPGVGKTYRMLQEGNKMLEDGEDIVIGYVEDHDRLETRQQIGKLEIIERTKTKYRGINLEEMSVLNILKRNPNWVIVDELAHTNIPASKNKKRYEDVLELLDNGINILTTVNIQHIESLNDMVSEITGIKVRETIPDRMLQIADDIMVIDLPPESLITRLKSGKIYKKENIQRSLENFFVKSNLIALRELALREAANEIDDDLTILKRNREFKNHIRINEKVLVCVSSNPQSSRLIRHAYRVARRYKCNLYVLIVDCTNVVAKREYKEMDKVLEGHKKLAKALDAIIVEKQSKSVSKAIVDFANEEGITQIILGHSNRSKIQTLFRGSTINKVLSEAPNVEVRVIPYVQIQD